MFVSNRPTPRHGDRPSSPVLVVSLPPSSSSYEMPSFSLAPLWSDDDAFRVSNNGRIFFFWGGVSVLRSVGDGAAPAGAKGHGRRRHLHPSWGGERERSPESCSLPGKAHRRGGREEGGGTHHHLPSLPAERAKWCWDEGGRSGGMKKDGGKIEMRKGKRAPTYCKSRM